jgi:Methyltransferase domain
MSEDRYTERFLPDWCPSPQYWHSADREATEFEVTTLIGAFVTALQPEVVVETGSYTGQTSAAIGRALQASGHGHLYTVEMMPAAAETAVRAVAGLPVTVTCSDSVEWLRLTPLPAPAQFAWIDSGNHQVRVAEVRVMLELERLAPGAIVGIHDTGPFFTEAEAAWAPLEEEGWLKMITLRTPRGVSFAQVL